MLKHTSPCDASCAFIIGVSITTKTAASDASKILPKDKHQVLTGGKFCYLWLPCAQLKLVSPSATRLEHLVTQLKWRLQEGQGEAIYQIGVEDSGLLAGLSAAEMNASLQTLQTMADRCSVFIWNQYFCIHLLPVSVQGFSFYYLVVGECFFWYRLTWIVPDKIHRAVRWLFVHVLGRG